MVSSSRSVVSLSLGNTLSSRSGVSSSLGNTLSSRSGVSSSLGNTGALRRPTCHAPDRPAPVEGGCSLSSATKAASFPKLFYINKTSQIFFSILNLQVAASLHALFKLSNLLCYLFFTSPFLHIKFFINIHRCFPSNLSLLITIYHSSSQHS